MAESLPQVASGVVVDSNGAAGTKIYLFPPMPFFAVITPADLSCPFRIDIQGHGDDETATCDFLRRLIDAPAEHCSVHRSACELCVQHPPLSPASLNPVLPSLILDVCRNAFPDAASESAAGVLANWARSAVATDGMGMLAPANHGCDCALVADPGVTEASLQIAVDSALAQDRVQTIVHLVGNGSETFATLDAFANRPNIRLHRQESTTDFWKSLERILPFLETQMLALLMPGQQNAVDRLSHAIEKMETEGAELFAATLRRNDQRIRATPESLPLGTVVIRRGTIADMGELNLERALEHGRGIAISDNVAVVEKSSFSPSASRAEKSGAKMTPFPFSAACDVVLPFRDSLEQVAQSLDALLAQRDAELVIHLVDDLSRGDTDAFFQRYRHHDHIRFYRNRENLGPFASFNNIALRAETDFIAVQDADDISMPHRMARSFHLLKTTGADILGSRTILFGDAPLIPDVAHDCETDDEGHKQYYRNSRYPKRHLSGYFLENPTLVMRVDAFLALGGYGDFGGGARNRTGVDTDFQLRAHFARAAITVTRDTLVRYRVHGQSATHHSESGFGSQANAESHAEVRRRFERYCTGTFDPRWFGALRQHVDRTERIDP